MNIKTVPKGINKVKNRIFEMGLGRALNPIRSIIMPRTRPWGMHPTMWEDYKKTVVASKLPFFPAITQTVGSARASAGYHAADGYFTNNKGQREPYCAAVDISVRGFYSSKNGYDTKRIKWFLWNCTLNDYIGWYRFKRSFANNRHMHIVYVNINSKPQLQRQIIDFLNNKEGLVGDRDETFWVAPESRQKELYANFRKHNPQLGASIEGEIKEESSPCNLH